MFITNMTLPRRTFLRGVGAALALPWLDAMRPALSLSAAAATPTSRYAFLYVPHGVILDRFTPRSCTGRAGVM